MLQIGIYLGCFSRFRNGGLAVGVQRVPQVVFGQDGLPVTTKQEDASMHGIGLSNVRRAAEKYMGELELKAEQHLKQGSAAGYR